MTHVSNLLRLVTALEGGGVTERGKDRDRRKVTGGKEKDGDGGGRQARKWA